jgi:hypothetical protein
MKQHGTNSMYQSMGVRGDQGCRCDLCREAHRKARAKTLIKKQLQQVATMPALGRKAMQNEFARQSVGFYTAMNRNRHGWKTTLGKKQAEALQIEAIKKQVGRVEQLRSQLERTKCQREQ